MDVQLPGFIKQKAAILEKSGIDQAPAEVELILCHLLGTDRMHLFLNGPRLIDEQLVAKLDGLLAHRATRYPLQYILEESWFYGRKFFVSPAVMVPTPETEVLCETALGFCRYREYTRPRILDIGVGSGVISVTMANELADCEIVALDKSEDAIAVAQKNARNLGGSDRIEFRQSDFFSSVGEGEQFDLILSNPPYIADRDYAGLPPEVLADPKLALTSGVEGLDAIRVILREAPSHLATGGRLMFEIGYDQSEKVAAITEQDRRYTSLSIIKDLNDIDRVIVLGCTE